MDTISIRNVIAQGMLIWSSRIGENCHTHLHSLHWYSTADWSIATTTGALTPATTRLHQVEIRWASTQ